MFIRGMSVDLLSSKKSSKRRVCESEDSVDNICIDMRINESSNC